MCDPLHSPDAKCGSFEHLKTQYDIFRDYMKHEDDLLNHRTTWHLVVQGFLLGALGLVIHRPADNAVEANPEVHHALALYISLTGLVVGAVALFGVAAANFAIWKLWGEWKSQVEPKYESPLPVLPGIAGAGSRMAWWMGAAPPIAIPLVLTIIWSIILHMSLGNKLDPATPPDTPKPSVPACVCPCQTDCKALPASRSARQRPQHKTAATP